MTIETKKQYLAKYIFADEISKGNLPANLAYMTDSEVNMYFDGIAGILAIVQILAN